MELNRLIRHHLRPYRLQVLIVCIVQFAAVIATLWLPSLNADIIDNGVVTGDTGYILRIGAVMLVASAGQIALTATAVYYASKVAMGVGRDIRARLFAQVQTYSEREVAHFGAPSLITRTTNDVQQVQMLVQMTLTLIIQSPVMLVGGVVMSLRQDLVLSWLLVVLIPLIAALMTFIIAKSTPLFRSMQDRIDRINQVLREQITGVRVVRAFVREPYEQARFARASNDLRDTQLRVGMLMAFSFPLVMLIANLASVAVLWFGGYRIDAGSMQVGAITAFITYIMQILMSVMFASMIFFMLPRAQVCAERINGVLDTTTSVVPPATPTPSPAARGHLEFDAVTFSYPGAAEPVLHSVCLVAEPGTTTAIIGATGSGKTTLVNLVPRLFDVTSGSVRLDGVDVREYDPQVLWGRIGLVPQRPYLFSGTVASNLRYGNSEASEDELWRALEVAQAAEFVRAMPEGLEAPISQGGTNVSGGQRQRLAIARALVRRPNIYLFDDSFSALDYATDAALRAALVPHTRDASVLVVAQRVATIRNAHRIYVLDQGVVVAAGTHDELMASSPEYAEIVLSQISAEEAA
jgi:ATP-binding cassette subfamily B multidrug efflux pump